MSDIYFTILLPFSNKHILSLKFKINVLLNYLGNLSFLSLPVCFIFFQMCLFPLSPLLQLQFSFFSFEDTEISTLVLASSDAQKTMWYWGSNLWLQHAKLDIQPSISLALIIVIWHACFYSGFLLGLLYSNADFVMTMLVHLHLWVLFQALSLDCWCYIRHKWRELLGPGSSHLFGEILELMVPQ